MHQILLMFYKVFLHRSDWLKHKGRKIHKVCVCFDNPNSKKNGRATCISQLSKSSDARTYLN